MAANVTTSTAIFPSFEAATIAARQMMPENSQTTLQKTPLSREEGGMPLFVLDYGYFPAGEDEVTSYPYAGYYEDYLEKWGADAGATVFQETRQGRRALTVLYWHDGTPHESTFLREGWDNKWDEELQLLAKEAERQGREEIISSAHQMAGESMGDEWWEKEIAWLRGVLNMPE